MSAIVRRVLIEASPFGPAQFDPKTPWNEPAQWPCRWIAADPAPTSPAVVAYRCMFDWEISRTVRVHITADESYDLYLDGERIGEGSEHGDRGNWFFESYEIDLAPGRHVLAAMVKQLGSARAAARVSVRPGLLCAPENDPEALSKFGTGVAKWEAAPIEAIRPLSLADELGGPPLIGSGYEVDLRALPADWSLSEKLKWGAVRSHEPGNGGKVLYPAGAMHLLRPSTLPPMRANRFSGWVHRKSTPPISEEKISRWNEVLNSSGAVIVPQSATQEIIFDNETYLCANIELEISGGKDSRIELAWAEMVRGQDGEKGNRDRVDGTFRGIRDVLIADGSHRRIRLPQWRPGRYLQLKITTVDAPLTLHRLATIETGYPLNDGSAQWQSSDATLDRILHVSRQTALACAHDTYVDCPFYEQLQYVGDVHMQSLVTYCLTPDARLVRKAIEMFLASRHNPTGLPSAAYPSGGGAVIAPFALVLISIVHDYALWRDDRAFVTSCLPALRGVVDWFLAHRGDDGLIRSPFGWNFIDANLGQIPPGGSPGEVSGLINWQLAGALTRLARLEESSGEKELAARFNRIGREIAGRLSEQLFDRSRGAFLDAPNSKQCSEHGQALAILSGLLSSEHRAAAQRALIEDKDLIRTGAAFTHYLFDAYREMNQPDLLYDRLQPWRWAIEQGFRTFPEYIGINTRSDCHGWSAHPLYHYFATLLGIRPAEWGFRSVQIAPQLPESLNHLSGTMAHPAGVIELSLNRDRQHLTAELSLPESLEGEMIWAGEAKPICGGKSVLRW